MPTSRDYTDAPRNRRVDSASSPADSEGERRRPLAPSSRAFNPDEEGEPLSVAEELVSGRSAPKDDADLRYEQIKQSGDVHLAQLQKMSTAELIEEARKENVAECAGMNRQDLIFRILKERVKFNGMVYGEGTLEILPDGFGFLRTPDYHYLSCPDDIYVSPSQIRRFGLRTGSTVSGQIRPPKENERYFALLRVEAINYEDPNLQASRVFFDDLTPMHPDARIVMEAFSDDLNTRVSDLITPVGFGQRGLIVSPPRAGKTILMQKMAKAALKNYPDLYVFMLLIDERPEEVTDMERQVKGKNCEVISSTFDEAAERHIQVSEMVIEKAKRMVEYGRDVMIFLDSITRLARAWNAECPPSGKILSGGVDANALQRPKRFFGAARKLEEGGSLTIIATALVDTGSRMDEVIFEEFKGTGNLEIVLDRRLVDRRIWPSIDINRSGTRREEMLMDPEEHRRVCVLRRILSEMNPPDAMELLVSRLAKTKTNAEFLMSMNMK
jgi:transcription termination factor Rho